MDPTACHEYTTESVFDLDNDILFCLEVVQDQLGISVLNLHDGILFTTPQDFKLTISYDSKSFDGGGKYITEINDIVQYIIRRYLPTVCLLSSRLHEDVYKYIENKCLNEDEMDEFNDLQYNIILQNNQNMKRYSDLHMLVSDNDNESQQVVKNLIIQSQSLSKATAATIGCVINFLRHQSNINDFEEDSSVTQIDMNNNISQHIKKIKPLTINDSMILDNDTIASLQVLPILRKTGQDNFIKDGYLSLLELLDHTSSTYGKNLLRSWLLSPLTNKEKIKARTSTIKTLLNNSNKLLFDDVKTHLKGIPNLFPVVNQLRDGKENYNTWIKLWKFAENGLSLLQIISCFRLDDHESNVISKIRKEVDVNILKKVLKNLSSVLDIDGTIDRKETVILNGVNADLDESRSIFQQLEEILDDVANISEKLITDILTEEQISSLRANFENTLVNSLYIPGLGYLISINVEIEEYFSAFESLNWDNVFRTNTHIYFKTNQVIQLDKEYGDIYSIISDIEIEILLQLKCNLSEYYSTICYYFELIANLDVLQSFAFVAQERRYVEPQLVTDQCIIEIENGRHALFESFTSNYIANDISIDGGQFNNDNWFKTDNKRITVITGANASGKTVFLTQIAIICYLAQVGSFVPASRAKIGIIDRILTRIRTRESISKLHSSFQIDCMQMSNALAFKTEKSLILIDEFGKGTDVNDGPGLFGSILTTLAKDPHCPRVIACTHFHELFQPHILSTQVNGIQHYTTEVLLCGNDTNKSFNTSRLSQLDVKGQENMGLTFLYRLKKGISTQSFGVYCAKICGMKPEIVKRASEISELINQGNDIEDFFSEVKEDDLLLFQKNQDIIKKFLSWDLDLESSEDTQLLIEKLYNVLNR